MNTLFGLPDIAPLGAGIELVDENDPAVTPRLLAIEASSMGEATIIIKEIPRLPDVAPTSVTQFQP